MSYAVNKFLLFIIFLNSIFSSDELREQLSNLEKPHKNPLGTFFISSLFSAGLISTLVILKNKYKDRSPFLKKDIYLYPLLGLATISPFFFMYRNKISCLITNNNKNKDISVIKGVPLEYTANPSEQELKDLRTLVITEGPQNYSRDTIKQNCQKMLEQYPDNVNFLYVIATITKNQLRNYKVSTKIFKELLKLLEKQPNITWHDTYYKIPMDQNELILKIDTNILQNYLMDPTNQEALLYADELIKKHGTKNNNRANLCAKIYEENKKFEKAIELYSEDLIKNYEHIAEIYKKELNDETKAKEIYEKTLNLCNENFTDNYTIMLDIYEKYLPDNEQEKETLKKAIKELKEIDFSNLIYNGYKEIHKVINLYLKLEKTLTNEKLYPDAIKCYHEKNNFINEISKKYPYWEEEFSDRIYQNKTYECLKYEKKYKETIKELTKKEKMLSNKLENTKKATFASYDVKNKEIKLEKIKISETEQEKAITLEEWGDSLLDNHNKIEANSKYNESIDIWQKNKTIELYKEFNTLNQSDYYKINEEDDNHKQAIARLTDKINKTK